MSTAPDPMAMMAEQLARPRKGAAMPLAVASLEQRVEAVLAFVEAVQSGTEPDPRTARWLADGLWRFLIDGVELDKALGLRARRGSHRTAQAVIDDERRELPGAPGCAA